MAEVDWDKIIKSAQSKKKEEAKRDDLEKRLKRMESQLRKVAAEKEAAPERQAPRPSRADSLKRLLRIRSEEDRMSNRLEKLERLEHELEKKSGASEGRDDVPPGFKIVRVPRRSAVQLGKAGAAVGEKLQAGAKALFSSRRNMIAVVGVLVAAAVAGLYLTGNLQMPTLDASGLTGLFTGKPKVTYVCADGVTTVDNMTMCPTTTTTTTTSTLPPITTTTTTLPLCECMTTGSCYCIYLKQLTCNGGRISAVLINSGSKNFAPDPNGGINPIMLIKFLVDGTEQSFTCVPTLVSVGAETTCTYVIPTVGMLNVEIRGVSVGNIEKGTVTC
jgi:hypothetical protein